jgi:hypothetical protein
MHGMVLQPCVSGGDKAIPSYGKTCNNNGFEKKSENNHSCHSGESRNPGKKVILDPGFRRGDGFDDFLRMHPEYAGFRRRREGYRWN